MKKRAILLILFLFILPLAFAHGEDQYIGPELPGYPVSQLQAVGYGSLAFIFLCILILLLKNKMSETAKKLVYSFLLIIVASVTGYLAITTLHTNAVSVTKGPVHWHADYEIWICDQQVSLPEPGGMSNKQGTDLLHSHVDDRMHIEGALMQKSQASLGAFFYAIGGHLSSDEIAIPTDDGLISKHDGDLCNGKPGRLYVFVNGKLNEFPQAHIIAPYEKVPPGDKIKIIFTEKQAEEINPDIG